MAGVLAGVDERTKLVGHNRLELLLFKLDTKQRFGINVFKVREVVSCPPLKKLPAAHPAVAGVITMRGQTFTVVDLQKAIGKPGVEDPENCKVIIADYNRVTQGFLVSSIENIVNLNWENIQQPPLATGKNHFLTAVTQVDGELVEILDVEKVLYDITGVLVNKEAELDETAPMQQAEDFTVLVADDSAIARKQIVRTLEKIGIKIITRNDGRAALNTLREWADNDSEEFKSLLMLISDVEMPEMDGYTLVSELRSDPRFVNLKIYMHTSLSGVFDSSLTKQVQADGFLSKFDSQELVQIVRDALEEKVGK